MRTQIKTIAQRDHLNPNTESNTMKTRNEKQIEQWKRKRVGLNAGHTRISKRQWQNLGGLQFSDLFRKADSRGVWTYWRI